MWMRGRVCRCGRRVAVGHHPLGASGASSCYSLPSSSRSGLRACTPLLSCRLMVGTRVPSERYARRRVVLPVRGRVEPGGLWWRLAGPTVYSLLGGGTWVCREVQQSAGGLFLLFFVGGGALRHCSLCARWKCASIGSVWLLISGMSAIFFVLWLCLPCSHAFFPLYTSFLFDHGELLYSFFRIFSVRATPHCPPLPLASTVCCLRIGRFKYLSKLVLIHSTLNVILRRGACPRQPPRSTVASCRR